MNKRMGMEMLSTEEICRGKGCSMMPRYERIAWIILVLFYDSFLFIH